MGPQVFLSEMIFLHRSKKDFVLNKKEKKNASENLLHSQDMSFFVSGHTLRLTAGRAFGCLFLKNRAETNPDFIESES